MPKKTGRPKKPAADKKTPILFARVEPATERAFRRFCEEQHGEAPSVVLRRLVREALIGAGYLPSAPKGKV